MNTSDINFNVPLDMDHMYEVRLPSQSVAQPKSLT